MKKILFTLILFIGLGTVGAVAQTTRLVVEDYNIYRGNAKFISFILKDSNGTATKEFCITSGYNWQDGLTEIRVEEATSDFDYKIVSKSFSRVEMLIPQGHYLVHCWQNKNDITGEDYDDYVWSNGIATKCGLGADFPHEGPFQINISVR